MKKEQKDIRRATDVDIEKKLHFLIERKRDILQQYLKMTEKMQLLVEDSDIKNLHGFVSERQKCIRKVNRIDISVKKILDNVSTVSNRIPLEINPMIDGRITDLKTIVASIETSDKGLIRAAQSEGDRLKKELLKLRDFRQANKGYGPHRTYSSKFVDIRN